MGHFRKYLYIRLIPEAWPKSGFSGLNKIVLAVILTSILSAIVETEPELGHAFPATFKSLNVFFGIFFLVEYAGRLWVIGEEPEYRSIMGRLRYARSLANVADLLATIIIWVGLLVDINGFLGVLLRFVRVARLLRYIRRSKWADAIVALRQAILTRKRELTLSFGLAAVVVVVSATTLYLVEADIQPKAFGSIPRAMWWAVVTLTTIGYGDAYPATALGKICASVVGMTSLAVVAMPTGILAAAFSDAFQDLQEKTEAAKTEA